MNSIRHLQLPIVDMLMPLRHVKDINNQCTHTIHLLLDAGYP